MDIVSLIEDLVKRLNEAEEKFFENPKDFFTLETSVKSSTEAFAAKYLGMLISSINRQIYEDGWRQGKYKVQRNDRRTLITSVGDVTFESTYYQSVEAPKEYHYLTEEIIGLGSHERFSEAAEAVLLTEALKSSYAEAARAIPSKQKITRTTVMNKVHGIAKELPEEKAEKQKEVPYLFIEADEDHVAQQHGRWTDKKDNKSFISKLAYVYEYRQENPKCRGRRELVNTFYFGGVYEEGKGVRDFWDNVFKYISNNYNYENINKIYLIGDGAGWIKSGVNHIPKSVFCADKYHLMKYINRASNQMLDEADNAKAEIYRLLEARRKKQLTAYIDSMAGSTDNQEPVTALKTFITRNWEGVMRSLHDSIVSGCSAEGHVSHVLSDRLSSRPKGWSKTGADRMSKLRCYEKNHGREKIVELVRYSREKRMLERTGTDGISIEDVKLRDIIREHKDSTKKYMDTMQATIPGMTVRKIISIREQLKLI